jgi:hypothetical protein
MAKILKVKITKTDLGNGLAKFNCPPGFDPTKLGDIVWERGGIGIADEDCIIVVPDEDAPAFLSYGGATELTQEDANTLGSVYKPQITKMSDSQSIIPIVAKLRASQALTQEEDDIINPDNPAKGINKTQAFPERLTAALIKVG